MAAGGAAAAAAVAPTAAAGWKSSVAGWKGSRARPKWPRAAAPLSRCPFSLLNLKLLPRSPAVKSQHLVRARVRGRLVRRSERRPSSEADFIESGERVQRAERVQNEFSAEAVRGPHGRFGGVHGLRRASQAVWRRPSSAAASTFGPIAAKGGKTMDVRCSWRARGRVRMV